MLYVAVLSFALCLACGANGSSPLLSEEEISKLPAELQYVLPSHGLHFHHTRVGFKHRYVDHAGSVHTVQPRVPTITVDATMTVSDAALDKATLIIGFMCRHMSSEIFSYVSRGHGVGIFAKSEGMGVYPENYRLRDTPQCKGTCSGSCAHTCTFDGRKYDSIAGLTNTRSVVLEDNVLCNANDPYRHQENVLVHEFAHQVHKYMPTADRNRLEYIFNYIKAHHVWQNGYGTANSAEYWAEATSSFFMTVTRHGQGSPAVGMDECSFTHVCYNEMEARQWLKTHDIWLYNLLVKIYTNNNPTIPSGLKVCQ